jgi:O-acetylhomoserine (thiol)-lyase
MTTSFAFKDAQHGADLFSLSKLGPIYTRIMNPTNHTMEYRVAKLEGAPCPLHGDCDNAATLPSALAVASGQSAQMQAMLTFMQAGDNFVCSSELYGGSYTLFVHTFAQLGIGCRLYDVTKPGSIEALIDEDTKAIYVETIGNPSYNVPDFAATSAIAKVSRHPPHTAP